MKKITDVHGRSWIDGEKRVKTVTVSYVTKIERHTAFLTVKLSKASKIGLWVFKQNIFIERSKSDRSADSFLSFLFKNKSIFFCHRNITL